MDARVDTFIEVEYIVKELLKPLSSETNSSSSDILSENEPRQEKRSCIRIKGYINVIKKYSEYEFKAHFRLARTTVHTIIGLFQNSVYVPHHQIGRKHISAERAFLLVIWYLVNQESFREVADRFDVTLSSAYRCLRRVLKFILSMRQVIIKWPAAEEAVRISERFYHKQRISNILGAVDGSHIEIPKPKINQAAYINRKGYHSLLLQGIVDYRKKFLDVCCGEVGSMHDARVLRKSKIYEKIINNPIMIGERFLLGDTAYPNLQWLVTPFKENGYLTQQQNIFNYRVSASRIVVEHAFALLKGRFRRLRKLDNLNIPLCSEIIMSACVLHNICIDANDLIDVNGNDFNQPGNIPYDPNCNIPVNLQGNRQRIFNEMFNI